jgi:hypothetical protein
MLGALLVWAAAPGCGRSQLRTTPLSGGAGGEGAGGGGSAAGGVAGSGAGGGEAGGGPVDFCKGCELQPGCSSFADGDILEASGIASSSVMDGAFYVHNDSGDKPRFFATSCAGDDLGTYTLLGAAAYDWEDMARGPCDGKPCLFFADIGDNDAVRPDIAVYRVVEPASLGPGKFTLASEKMTFTYPDGAHDAETFLVHPRTGEMAIVTKVFRGKSGVYVSPSPFSPGASAVLVKAGDIEPPSGSVRFTSGSVHPGGEGILLRTYTSLFFYAMAKDQSIAQALAVSPCNMPVMLELQGESVSFTAKGDGYVTVSEQSGQSLHFVACD